MEADAHVAQVAQSLYLGEINVEPAIPEDSRTPTARMTDTAEQ